MSQSLHSNLWVWCTVGVVDLSLLCNHHARVWQTIGLGSHIRHGLWGINGPLWCLRWHVVHGSSLMVCAYISLLWVVSKLCHWLRLPKCVALSTATPTARL